MDERIKQIVENIQFLFGLQVYYLQRYQIDYRVNMSNETIYVLSMEWFPNHEEQRTEEELNPDGTAVIEIDLHSKQLEHIIFVNDVTYAQQGISFQQPVRSEVIHWVEEETGMTFEKDFQIDDETEYLFRFVASHNGIPVYPQASIEVKVDEQGNLTHYSKIGYFPSKEEYHEDTFTLSLSDIKNIVKEQIKVVEWPNYEQEQMDYLYGVEELFVTNDQKDSIPYEAVELPGAYVSMNEVIYVSSKDQPPFKEQELKWANEVDMDAAFANEPSPDARLITEEEVMTCTENVQTFVSQVYVEEESDWILTMLYRKKGYIQAILKKKETSHRPFKRKLVVFIDSKTFEVLNYVDNNLMVKAMDSFEAPKRIEVSTGEAYEKLKNHISLEAYYVYQIETRSYVLCGKVDSHYAVDAHTGALTDVDEL